MTYAAPNRHDLASLVTLLARVVFVLVVCLAPQPLGAQSDLPRVIGIGLSDTKADVDRRLHTRPGVKEVERRPYDGGSVEYRYDLVDGAFVRVAYARDVDTERPRFISVDLFSADAVKATLPSMADRLGPPTWQEKTEKGAASWRIWNGKGGPEAGVAPTRGAAFVVEMRQPAPDAATVILARPDWYNQ